VIFFRQGVTKLGRNMTMTSEAEFILFEGEDEKRLYSWRLAQLKLDEIAGAITIQGVSGQQWTISIPVKEISGFEIVMSESINAWLHDPPVARQGTNTLADIPILISNAIIRSGSRRKIRTPVRVLKLTQLSSEPNQGWVIQMRSSKKGDAGREETRRLADRLSEFLAQNGYSGLMPETDAVLGSIVSSDREVVAMTETNGQEVGFRPWPKLVVGIVLAPIVIAPLIVWLTFRDPDVALMCGFPVPALISIPALYFGLRAARKIQAQPENINLLTDIMAIIAGQYVLTGLYLFLALALAAM
jgi:hypothetical protein